MNLERQLVKKKVKDVNLNYIRTELEDVANKLNELKEKEEMGKKLENAINRLITSIDHFNNKE